MERRRVGVILNPIAGMGGRVGLKGTDGIDMLRIARERGAPSLAPDRFARALARLAPLRDEITLVTARDPMGERQGRALGFHIHTLPIPAGEETGPADTRAAALAMKERGVEIILFAGGDGTARDIHDAVGQDVPILGIPTGVKMHSAIFATSPENAGNVAHLFLSDTEGRVQMREAEVMDIDEEALRQNRVSARLYGYARAPVERSLMQAGKASSVLSDEQALDALAGRIVAEMEPGRLYIFGCGTTTRRIKRRLGFEGTLLGVDVVIDKRPLALDVTEERLLRLVEGAKATIITSVTGGQGFIFGRGNQQISAEVIRRVGRENIVIVTGAAKLMALDPPQLRVDTGDAEIDRLLAGYVQVQTAPGQAMMMRVAA